MGNLDINLLPKKSAREIRSQRVLEKFQRASLFLLMGYGVLIVVVFGVRLIFRQTKVSLQRQEVEARAAVESLAVVESQHILIKTKLAAASEILEKDKNWYEFSNSLMRFIPSELTVTEIGVDNGDTFRLGVETRGLQEFAVMLNALVEFGTQSSQVSEMMLENVQKSAEGFYAFKLAFKM